MVFSVFCNSFTFMTTAWNQAWVSAMTTTHGNGFGGIAVLNWKAAWAYSSWVAIQCAYIGGIQTSLGSSVDCSQALRYDCNSLPPWWLHDEYSQWGWSQDAFEHPIELWIFVAISKWVIKDAQKISSISWWDYYLMGRGVKPSCTIRWSHHVPL